MAVVTFTGFEAGTASTGIGELHTTAAGTLSVQNSVVRTGTYALRVNPTTTGTGQFILQKPHANTSLVSFGIAGSTYNRFYFRYATKPASNNEPFASVYNISAAVMLELRLNSSGNVELYNNPGTLVGTSSTALSQDTWYRIEFRASVGTSGAYELRIDGVAEIGPGTTNQASANISDLRLGKQANRNSQSVDFYYDDVYVDDAAFPGAGQCVKLGVTGNGSTMQWTAGTGASDYTQVDEIPRNGTDYIQSTAAGDIALMAFENSSVPGISGTINAVMFSSANTEVSSGADQIKLRVKSGGTNSDSSIGTAGAAGSSATNAMVLATDPDTSAAWTTSGLDAVEFGIIDDATSAVRIRSTFMLIWVDYTPSGGGSAVPLLMQMYSGS